MLIRLRFLLTIELYMHAHQKATAKNHRAMKMRDLSLDVSLYFWFMMDVSQRRGSQKSWNSKASRTFRIRERPGIQLCCIVVFLCSWFVLMCFSCVIIVLLLLLLLIVFLFVFVFFSFAERQSEIENRKLASWTLGNVEVCRCFTLLFNDVDDSFCMCFTKMRCSNRRSACFWSDSDILLFLSFVLSMEVYTHVH